MLLRPSSGGWVIRELIRAETRPIVKEMGINVPAHPDLDLLGPPTSHTTYYTNYNGVQPAGLGLGNQSWTTTHMAKVLLGLCLQALSPPGSNRACSHVT